MSTKEKVASVPEFFHGREDEHMRKLAAALNLVLAGKLNNVSSVTLSTGTTQTVVTTLRVTADTVVSLTAQTASAAAATGVWVETTIDKITVHHDSSADTDRTFGVTRFG